MEMEKFKSAMAAAQSAEESLRDGLRALGVPDRDLRQLRSRVLVDGRPVVIVGVWPTDTTERVAAALQLGAAIDEAQKT